jgi:tetratricopeptide (TPR) repeat protein
MTRIADGFKRKRNFEASKKYYLMALKRSPHDPYGLMGLGDIRAREGNDEEALRCFEKLIGIFDDSIMALTSAANIYRKQKDYGKAMDYYERALELNPRNSHAWHGKADCFRGMRDYRSAIEAWSVALKYGMNPRIAITRIGDAYLSLKELEQAESNYKNALAQGYYKYAYLGMARVHISRNHVEKASKILEILVEKEPRDSRIVAELRGLLGQQV